MSFDKIGLMLDCSRNAVAKVETLKVMLDLMARMGYNRLELYTEDTYEIEGRPYFGHLRGRYSCEELQEIDQYAAQRGIELVPCIQVLAHLNQMFRWPGFHAIRDCNDILLVDEPETYRLIEDMFASLAKAFSSRNVNIGCDEAHMVGLGRFLERNGLQDRFEIINRHVGRVLKIAERYGFKCAMWSDMYFRLISGGEYYNTDKPLPQEVLDRVPTDVSLIYWDYYNTDIEVYRKMLAGHRRFKNNIEFAGGAWKWSGFAPDNAHSISTFSTAITAAREYGVKNVMVTAWGDDGAEASMFGILPSLYYFSRLCQGLSVAPEDLDKGFRALTGVGFEDFIAIDSINSFAWETQGKHGNAEKILLYNDCFSGIFDSRITGGEAEHYRQVAERLKKGSYGKFGYVFKTIQNLCDVLEIKADLGVRTRKMYLEGNREGLKHLVEQYALVKKRVVAFYRQFERQWLKENKPNGFEVQDMRLGGLACRIDACRRRLQQYLAGKIASIPELEQDVLEFEWGRIFNQHPYIITPCVTIHS